MVFLPGSEVNLHDARVYYIYTCYFVQNSIKCFFMFWITEALECGGRFDEGGMPRQHGSGAGYGGGRKRFRLTAVEEFTWRGEGWVGGGGKINGGRRRDEVFIEEERRPVFLIGQGPSQRACGALSRIQRAGYRGTHPCIVSYPRHGMEWAHIDYVDGGPSREGGEAEFNS
jgi:hypothetical protein